MRQWSKSPKAKYGNHKITVDGVSFDSKGESARWETLKLLARAGEITELERQVTFRLEVNCQLICKFIADYTYKDKNGKYTVEDYKSDATAQEPAFRIKMKLMRACHGIDVQIIKAKSAWGNKPNKKQVSELWF